VLTRGIDAATACCPLGSPRGCAPCSQGHSLAYSAALWLTALNVGAPGPWNLLVDGALLAACREVGRAPDAHIKFHAMSVAAVALLKVQHCWQQAAQQGLIAPAAVQVRWARCRGKHPGGASSAACGSNRLLMCRH
jgi:hypothetical protein